MKTGLLWYDDNPKHDLCHIIRQAAGRYRIKFGQEPDICYVHPSALGDNDKVNKVGAVRVSSRPAVLRHHFWIGKEEQSHGKR